jgi:hypothetical protein
MSTQATKIINLALQNAFDNGVNLGAFWTDTKDASDAAWTLQRPKYW